MSLPTQSQAASGSSVGGAAIASLSDGNFIVTGAWGPGVTMGGNTASFGKTTLESSGYFDFYIAKLDSSGNYLWVEQGSGNGDKTPFANTSLSDGSSILVGAFSGDATFGKTTLSNPDTTGFESDVFITKLDSNGNYLWAKQAGGNKNDEAYGITSLSDGSSIVTGTFEDTATFGDVTLTSAALDGIAQVFVAKLDPSGNYLWAKDPSSEITKGNLTAHAITSHSDGSSIITGNFQGSNYQQVYIAKLDSNGNNLWAKQVGATSESIAASISTSNGTNITTLDDGSSIFTGYFSGEVTFGDITLTSKGAGTSLFVSKLDSSGNFLWAKEGISTNSLEGFAITSQADGSSIVSGAFNGTATFGDTTLTSASPSLDPAADSFDAFIVKLDSSGNFLWAKQVEGVGKGPNGYASAGAYGITSLDDGSSIFIGEFAGEAIVGDITLKGNTDVLRDMYVAAVDADGNWLSFLEPKSPSGLLVDGSYFKNGGSTEIKLGGTYDGQGNQTATEYDWIEVIDDLELSGSLDVSLIDGFELDLNQEFDIVKVNGELTGTYEGLEEGAIVGKLDSVYGQIPMNLFITYEAGDGNDIALYTVDHIFGLSNI